MTGLSPRVIRVWFQNKRCKDKKRAILMKQQLQQEKVNRKGFSQNETNENQSNATVLWVETESARAGGRTKKKG